MEECTFWVLGAFSHGWNAAVVGVVFANEPGVQAQFTQATDGIAMGPIVLPGNLAYIPRRWLGATRPNEHMQTGG